MGRAPRRADWLWSAGSAGFLLRLGPAFTRIRSTFVGAAEVTVVGRLVCPRRRPLPTLTRFSRVAALHATDLRHTRHHIAV